MPLFRRLFQGWTPESLREEVRTGLIITFSCFLFAVTVTYFLVPARLPSAGITGLSLFFNYRLGWSLGLTSAAFNLVLFLYAWKALSRRFLIWSLYASACLSIFFEVTPYLPTFTIQDTMLMVVVSGVLQGLAFAMVFSVGASTGGTDIVVAAIKKRTGLEVGSVSMVLNLLVMLLFWGTITSDQLVYGFVMNYIMSLTMNSNMHAFGSRKEAFIVTRNPELVRDYILHQLHRGVTLFLAEGGFDKQPRHVLVTLLSTRQVVSLKLFLKQNDATAFMRLSDANEVLGSGFKPWTRDE